MKKIFIIVFGILVFTSCEKKEVKADCFKDDPFELDWLNEIRQTMIDDTTIYDIGTQNITMYTYGGNKVFQIDDCPACPDFGTSVLQCNGKEICFFGGIANLNTCPDFNDTKTDEEVIYSE